LARAKLVPLAAVDLDTAVVPRAVAIGADRRDTAVVPMRAGRTRRSRAVDLHTAVVPCARPSWCRSPRSGWAAAGLTREGRDRRQLFLPAKVIVADQAELASRSRDRRRPAGLRVETMSGHREMSVTIAFRRRGGARRVHLRVIAGRAVADTCRHCGKVASEH
jgi:hypothetical protein